VQLVIRAQGLVKSFRGARAVAGIDLVVAPGERVALLGPNGAGKTTTLLMLLGVITPDSGMVELLGHLLPRARSDAMQQVGFAAGYLPLPSRMKVHEVLRLFADLYGLDDIDPRIEDGL
jgi:ABC-2 type transport system ATP-binding protein